VVTLENTTIYHEIDFLLQTQRFNINFSYITQKGLPFVREFVLRLVNLAPMTNSQIASFFGFSSKEVEEAIADLVERDELTLANSGRLTLTEKSRSYFVEVGDVPRLSALMESSTRLSFDLATFTCLGKDITQDKWKSGIQLKVPDENVARSESHVQAAFQHQFNDIHRRGFLSKSLVQDEKDPPTVYTVNSVNKIRQMPLRLNVKFRLDKDGRSVEWEDFDALKSSDYVHERITIELDRLARPSNLMGIAQAMLAIGDTDTLKVLDSKDNTFNLQFFDDLIKLEENSQNKRDTFLGPVYSKENWNLLQKKLAPLLKSRIERKSELQNDSFIWLAPSDPYWCKNSRLLTSMSEFLSKASTKDKKLYSPTVYLPVSGPDDSRAAKQWKHELDSYIDRAHALTEGFLGGNVEVLLLEGKLVVIVYHISLPENFPVTLPLGFISEDPKVVSAVGRLVRDYVQGSAGLDRPNHCGTISTLISNG
jgi:hypothetical protein